MKAVQSWIRFQHGEVFPRTIEPGDLQIDGVYVTVATDPCPDVKPHMRVTENVESARRELLWIHAVQYQRTGAQEKERQHVVLETGPLLSKDYGSVSARQHLEDEIEHVRELLADLYLGSLWMVGHLCERVTGEAEAAEHRADQHDVRVEYVK